MLVFIISIMAAIICYIVGKKRSASKNGFVIIKNILWIEACIFMAAYFVIDRVIYKLIWNILMAVSAAFSLVYSVYLKREK